MSDIKSSNPETNTAAETIAVAAQQGHSPTGGEPPPVIATGYEGSVGDQLRAPVQRIRGGEMGMLPALAGLLVLSILFGFLSPFFFTKGNIANLMTQTAALMMLSIALTFVIILTEIDLSAGITGGVGMAVFIILVNDKSWNWVLAFVVALLVGAVIGTVHRLVRGQDRHPVLRRQPRPVPRLPGPDARPAGRRRHLPGPDAGSRGDHEQVDAAVGRLADARRHRAGLAGHRPLRPHAAAGRTGCRSGR